MTDPSGPMAPMFLAAFCGSTVAAITIMGGVFAVLPAYEVGCGKYLATGCLAFFLPDIRLGLRPDNRRKFPKMKLLYLLDILPGRGKNMKH